LVLLVPRIVIVLVTAWFLLSVVWDVNLSAALTALGVTSLVISFALQDTLSGLASGFLLLSDHPFRPGDWITADDIEGVVVDVNWRTTHIADRNGDTIVVPNSQLASTSITNRTSHNPVHRVVVNLQVAFSNPPTLAKDMLLAAARIPQLADIRRALQTSILLSALDDADLDRLAHASRPVRFSRGELMIDSATADRDVMVVVDGRADLVLLEPAADTGSASNTETVIGEIGAGESVGYLEAPRATGWLLALRAATDCEVVIVEASAAAEIASRSADVASAINRSAAMRRRRVERILEHRAIVS
jgi:CRP-like cAMP-binding protein